MTHNWKHEKSRHERGYGNEWTKTRITIMARDMNLCQVCMKNGRTTPAQEVDHILSKAKDGTDDHSNLQAICTPCHQAKTLREQGKKLKTQYNEQGLPVSEHHWNQ